MILIERNPRSSRSISLTPLIDVVFLLMVFFILSTNYVDIEALKLAVLEEDSEGTVITSSSAPHELVLLGSGATFLNNELIYYGDLEDKLEVMFANTPDAAIRLRCDNKVEVQLMVDVLDMIKRSGGQDVSVSHWKSGNGGL